MRKNIISLLLCAIMAVLFCASAFSVGFSLPVNVQVKGNAADAAEEYSVVIESKAEDCPMPEGSSDGKYIFGVAAGAEVMLPKIDFSKPGEYGYSVWQMPGTDSDCIYDDSVYDITVYVEKNGDELYLVAVVKKNNDGAKLENIVFVNVYDSATQEPVIKPDETEKPGLPLTGVQDYWMFYIGGAVLLLAVAGAMMFILMRRNTDKDE